MPHYRLSPDGRTAMADGSEIEPRHALSADELEERAWSTATVKAYRSDWADWEGWARGRNRQLFPALPADVAEYLADLSRRAKASTIGPRLSAIAWRHASQNVPFDRRDRPLART